MKAFNFYFFYSVCIVVLIFSNCTSNKTSDSSSSLMQHGLSKAQMEQIQPQLSAKNLMIADGAILFSNAVIEVYNEYSKDSVKAYLAALEDSLESDLGKYIYICPCDSLMILYRDTSLFDVDAIAIPIRPRPRKVFRESIISGNSGGDCNPDIANVSSAFNALISSTNINSNLNPTIVAMLSSGFDPTNESVMSYILRNSNESVSGPINYDDDGNGAVDDIYGYNFSTDIFNTNNSVNHNNSSYDILGEGSAMNQVFINGMSNKSNLKILPVKVYDENNFSSEFRLACGIKYAEIQGAKVLCISPGYYNLDIQNTLLSDVLTSYLAEDTSRIVFSSGGSDSILLDNVNQNHVPSGLSGTDNTLTRLYEVFAMQSDNINPLGISNCRTSTSNNSIAIKGDYNQLQCPGTANVNQFKGSEYATAKATQYYINNYISAGPNYFYQNYVSGLNLSTCPLHNSGKYKIIPVQL